MKDKAGLSSEESKIAVKILAFHALGKSITRHYKIKNLGRITRVIKKKWKKILPHIDEGHLVVESGVDPEKAEHALNIMVLYSNLYSDLIDEHAMKICTVCIAKLRSYNATPSLKEDFKEVIDHIVAVRPKPRQKDDREKPVKKLVYKEYPHLDPGVRERLVKYFKKELKEQEPIVMADQKLKLRVDTIVRAHVDRILDVALTHAYKAMQNGYIKRTPNDISGYVEGKGRSSIEWAIKNGVLLKELVRGIG